MKATALHEDETSPAIHAAVDALASHGIGPGYCGGGDHAEAEVWLAPSRESIAIARHRQTVEAIATNDYSAWRGQ